jgi:hypothetical protein
VDFYNLRGLLVRRGPVLRGIALERWDGEAWVPETDVDAVARYGIHLTEPHALRLLHALRERKGRLPALSDVAEYAALVGSRRGD